MPRFQTPDGQTVYVPGVYLATRVEDNNPGPVPAFHVPILVADVRDGYPADYDTNAAKLVTEPARGGFTFVSSAAQAADLFGAGSLAARALRFAFRHGLPYCWVITPQQSLARASIVASSGTATVQQMVIAAKRWGGRGNAIKLKHTAAGLEVLPPRFGSYLTVDGASGATRILVDDNSWIAPGQVLTIFDINTASASVTVKAVGTYLDAAKQVVQYVDLTAALAATFAIADGAQVVAYSEEDRLKSGVINGDDLIAWINETAGAWLVAARGTGYTGAALDNVATDTLLCEITSWLSPVDGASPAGSAANHLTLIGQLNASLFDNFVLNNQQIPRTYCVAWDDATAHGHWRDWAASQRAARVPVSITTGVSWGDTAVNGGGATDPAAQAQALASQDVTLCAPGLDREGAHLSLGPAVWARRVAGGLPHNLTQDALIYGEVETGWDERASRQLTILHQKGVCTIRRANSAPYRYVVSQGLSTLPQNTSAWNSDGSSPLLHQRDLADAINAALADELDGRQLGVEVTRDTLAATITRKARQLQRIGWIRSDVADGFVLRSLSLAAGGAGWVGEWAVRLPVPVDFIGGTSVVLVGGN